MASSSMPDRQGIDRLAERWDDCHRCAPDVRRARSRPSPRCSTMSRSTISGSTNSNAPESIEFLTETDGRCHLDEVDQQRRSGQRPRRLAAWRDRGGHPDVLILVPASWAWRQVQRPISVARPVRRLHSPDERPAIGRFWSLVEHGDARRSPIRPRNWTCMVQARSPAFVDTGTVASGAGRDGAAVGRRTADGTDVALPVVPVDAYR